MRTRKLIIATLTTFLFVAFNFAQAGSYNINRSCDSIKLTIAHKSLEEKYKSYMELADLYRYISSDSVANYAQRALKIASELKSVQYKAEAYHALGVNSLKSNNLDESIKYLEKSLLNSLKTKDYELIGLTYMRLGQWQLHIGKIHKSFYSYSQSYKAFDKANSVEGKAHILITLGNAYIDFKNNKKAEELFWLAKELLKQYRTNQIKDLATIRYVVSLTNQKNIKHCKDYLTNIKNDIKANKDYYLELLIDREECRLLFENSGHNLGIKQLQYATKKAISYGNDFELANNLNELAHFYQKCGYHHLSLKTLHQVKTLRRKMNFQKVYCSSLINLANGFIKVGALDSSLFYLKIAEKLSISNKINNDYIRVLDKYHQTYLELGDSSLALYYYSKYILLKQNFIRSQSANHSKLLQSNITKQSDMEELLAIEQNRNWNYSLIGFITILIFVLILGTIGYGYLELRKKNHLHSEIKYRLLLSQLYPRFVLESINTLKVEIQSDRLEESGTKLSDFARLIRTILINPINNFHLLERELNSMESYFCLQKMRLAPKFTYSIEVEPQIDPTNISIPPFLGHLLVEAWITLAAEIDTQDLFINSRFSLNNGILTQTFDTNIPFINLRLYGSLPTRDNLGTALQLLKTRFLFIQKSHALKLSFQLYQTISSDSNLTRCHAKLSIPLLPHATYPAIKG